MVEEPQKAEVKKEEVEPHIKLIRKILDDFSSHVEKDDLSEILLKGHLLMEHYLDHIMILIFDKNAKVHKKSFSIKIEELRNQDCFFDHSTTIAALSSLNKVRNELAHQLDFQVTVSQIDSIGYHLGKEYIIQRYKNYKQEKELLIWVIEKIVLNTCRLLWKNLEKEKESNK